MSLQATPAPLQIRLLEPDDWPGVWRLLEPVFRAGETFPHDPAISESEARALWVEQSLAVMVAVAATGAVVGTYYLRPNSLALGAHVANASTRSKPPGGPVHSPLDLIVGLSRCAANSKPV